MKIFILGGTGFLGGHLLPRLLEQGHDLSVLTRSKEKASSFQSNGIKGIVGDLLQPESFISRITPQDAIISIAMPEIQPGRISSNYFHRLQHQTTIYFSTAIAIAEQFNCPLIVTLGTSFCTRGNEIADESWSIDRFGMAMIGEFVDPLISVVINQGSPPLIQMLPGEIYGPGGLFKKLMYKWMKQSKYRIIGTGKNYIPRIHVEDCAEAYVRVLGKMPIGQSFILADDEPCTMREFVDYMANYMNIPTPKSIPGFIAKRVMGKMLYETVTMNCKVSNAKAKEYLGWNLKYPTYREGLVATINEIEHANIENK